MAMKFGTIEGKDVMMMSAAAVGVGLGITGVVMGVKNSKSIKGLESQVGTITGAMVSHGLVEAAPMTVAAIGKDKI